MTPDPITTDLEATLRRLKLGHLLDTLPERLVLARQQKLPHADFQVLGVGDEITRRDSPAVTLRATKARLDHTMHLEDWDTTVRVTYDQALLQELTTLRFLKTHAHVAIVGPVGVGKTFLAHVFGQIACRRGHTAQAVRADHLLKTLKHTRLDHTYEAEFRKLLTVDPLTLDDFALDALDAQESRDTHDLRLERDRASSIIVTSNRSLDEWLAAFADPMRVPSAPDRFTSNTYDLVMEGESYRHRQKPTRALPTSW